MLLENLHATKQLGAPLIGAVVHSFLYSIDEFPIPAISKLFTSLSRVIDLYLESSEQASFQTYQKLKDAVVNKIVNSKAPTSSGETSRDEINFRDVVRLSLTLSYE